MKRAFWMLAAALVLLLAACGAEGHDAADRTTDDLPPGLTWQDPVPLEAATEFSIRRSEEGYTLLSVAGDRSYLVIPQGMSIPQNLPSSVTPVRQPLNRIYLAGSAIMDMLVKLDVLDSVAYSALPEKDWTIPEAREEMARGNILYAGKYSAPDYELICGNGCDLALENTMLYHSPEVREQLERFSIPVLVDHASLEQTPLGRMEWIKLYGVLFQREDRAEEVYQRQADSIRSLTGTDAGKTVAFFYISSNGEVKIRRSDDYIPQLIRLAGGTYVFDELSGENRLSTVTLQWEEFFAAAKDADVLIYNSTVSEQIPDLNSLLTKNPLLKDFRGVKDGRVYCTKENFYQASMELGDFVKDLHRMLSGDTDSLTYLYRLE